jgi:hypothetical protein
MVSIYGANQAVFVEDTDNIEDYDYWVETFSDSQSVNPTQAALKAAGVFDGRRLTHVTHRVSIIVLPSQVDLIGVGMSIEIKASAALAGQYLGIDQTRRIAEVEWEPREDGRYWAHLSLDRPLRSRAPSSGSPAGVVAKSVSAIEVVSHTHVDDEVPTGTIDGVNDVFTLADDPDPPESLILVKNGMVQREGTGNDYVLVGDTITYEAGTIPETGDTHVAWYRTGI